MKTRYSKSTSPEPGIQHHHRQWGIAIVEFTIILPLLLFMFIATAEVGRLLYQYNTLTKTERNGVRYLASFAKIDFGNEVFTDPADVTAAQNLVVYGNIGGGGPALLPGLETNDVSMSVTGGSVVLTVNYDFSPMLFNSLPTFGLGDPITLEFPLNSSITMRVL